MFASNYGPREQLPKEARAYLDEACSEQEILKFIDEYEYPSPSHVSDVAALEWMNQCSKRGHDTKSLSKLVMVSSQSHGTVQVVDYLLKKRGVEPMAKSREVGRYKAPDWAHKLTFEAGSDGFNLLMANPNGNLATFLLIQHRQLLGLKRVSKIDVFDDDHYDHESHVPYKGASMVYYLEHLDAKGKPVAKAGTSGTGSGKKPKPGTSGGRSGKVEKPKSGGGRQGLRSGTTRHGGAKL